MRQNWNLRELFTLALEAGGTSLHLNSALPAVAKTKGGLVPLTEQYLTPDDCEDIAATLSTQAVHRLKQESFYGLEPGICRYRAELYRQRDVLSLVFKLAPWRLRPLEELGLPPNVPELLQARRGLILVCGPQGAGKSWTLAALLDYIHRQRSVRSLVLGDPLEFELEARLGMTTTQSVKQGHWEEALDQIEFSDVDVVALDDFPVRRTLERALELAEAGILVLATVRNALDVSSSLFELWTKHPAWLHHSLRERVSQALQAIIFQKLVAGMTDQEKFPATEIMVASPPMRHLIQEERFIQFYNSIQTGLNSGMHTLEQSLFELFRSGCIDEKTALSETRYPDDVRRSIGTWRSRD